MIEDTVETDSIDDIIALVDRMIQPIIAPQMTSTRWQEFIDYFQEMERRIFADESSPDGEPWEELKPETIRRKGHDIILIELQLLIDSMTDSGATHAIRETSDTELFFGTNREWAWTRGGRRGRCRRDRREHRTADDV